MVASNSGQPATPWWYRVPPPTVVLFTYSAAGTAIFMCLSTVPAAWAGGGLAAGLLAGCVHGMAQAAFRQRQHPDEPHS
ncbi:hypothetical protein GCM10010240_64770 [Streptomyces griseoviridis]|jgi:hypothetical protein|nr:hypothetical protein GCM10010240_64770 [Streptomyces griseoviridis]